MRGEQSELVRDTAGSRCVSTPIVDRCNVQKSVATCGGRKKRPQHMVEIRVLSATYDRKMQWIPGGHAWEQSVQSYPVISTLLWFHWWLLPGLYTCDRVTGLQSVPSLAVLQLYRILTRGGGCAQAKIDSS